MNKRSIYIRTPQYDKWRLSMATMGKLAFQEILQTVDTIIADIVQPHQILAAKCEIDKKSTNCQGRQAGDIPFLEYVAAKSLNFSYAQNRFRWCTKPVSVRPKNRFWLGQTGFGYAQKPLCVISKPP